MLDFGIWEAVPFNMRSGLPHPVLAAAISYTLSERRKELSQLEN